MLGAFGTCSNPGGPAASAIAAALHFFAASQCLLDEPYPRNAPVSNGSRFDFIVVGAGTAGSALAARLAADYQFSVLLVEAGGYPPDEAIIPGFRNVLKNSPYDWNFTTFDDGFSSQALRDARQVQTRGKMMGGTGSINDMVYSRGHPEDYYEWADIIGDSWNWTTVLNYFKKTENMTDERIVGDSELMQYHGIAGEIEVSGYKDTNFVTTKLLEAFNELGFETVNDMTYPNKIGAGRFSHTITNGRRDSSLTGLLNRVHSNDLHVMNDTYVTKIIIENNKAVGVTAITNNEEVVYYADKEVILSAGTFSSPKLLMLSGVGPKDHLQDFGIEVIQNLPVGNNLHDHVMILNFLVIEKGTCPLENSQNYFEIIKYLYDFTGTYSYSDSMGVYLPQNDRVPNIPHFAIYPTCMPSARLTLEDCLAVLGYDKTVCNKMVSVLQDHELLSVPVVLLKPQSRGWVRLNSTDPTQDPLIYSGVFNNVADFEGFTDAIKCALSVANTTYFRAQGARVLDIMWNKCSDLKDEDDRIHCYVRDYAMAAWHSVGTAAMGTVVDADLKVIGVDSLRVVDASVIPVIIRGNTNAAVVMLAEKAADSIKKVYGSDHYHAVTV